MNADYFEGRMVPPYAEYAAAADLIPVFLGTAVVDAPATARAAPRNT